HRECGEHTGPILCDSGESPRGSAVLASWRRACRKEHRAGFRRVRNLSPQSRGCAERHRAGSVTAWCALSHSGGDFLGTAGRRRKWWLKFGAGGRVPESCGLVATGQDGFPVGTESHGTDPALMLENSLERMQSACPGAQVAPNQTLQDNILLRGFS